MRLKFVMLVLAGLVHFTGSARAGLTITATGGTVSAGGGTLVIPVMVTSDSSDNLGNFTVVYDISPDSSNAVTPVASLEFVSPLTSATDPTLNDLHYVFNPLNPDLQSPPGASFAQDTNSVFGTATIPVGGTFYTHFAGADIYDGLTGVSATLVNGTNYVLTDLVVQYNAPSTTNLAGDVFDITLNALSSSFQDGVGGDPNLSFSPNADPNANPILTTVTVLPASQLLSTPEPSTIALSLSSILATGALFFRLRISARR